MLVRPLTAVLVVAATAAAWPIAFFYTNDCNSEPVLVLHEPPPAGRCGFFHDQVKSYSGGTDDKIQKVLLYYDPESCTYDAAHRTHSNHTINNNRNDCIPFKKNKEVPRAFTFIKEFLPAPRHTNLTASCNQLVVQS